MNKNLIRKLLTSLTAEQQDVLTFISEYTFTKLNRHITDKELMGINIAIQQGIFNLDYALIQAAVTEKMSVLQVFDKHGMLLKRIVSE